VLEHFQWKDEKAITKHLAKNKDEIADELVDTLWYLLTIAYKLNIDLPHSFERKYQINTKKYPVKKAYGNNKKILI
jgi:NTP pyrophosphatase (non-canonical NTP hydrolase)